MLHRSLGGPRQLILEAQAPREGYVCPGRRLYRACLGCHRNERVYGGFRGDDENIGAGRMYAAVSFAKQVLSIPRSPSRLRYRDGPPPSMVTFTEGPSKLLAARLRPWRSVSGRDGALPWPWNLALSPLKSPAPIVAIAPRRPGPSAVGAVRPVPSPPHRCLPRQHGSAARIAVCSEHRWGNFVGRVRGHGNGLRATKRGVGGGTCVGQELQVKP